MRIRNQVYLIALLLIIAGVGLFLWKALVIGLPLRPGAETEVWTVEARVSFRAEQGPARVVLRIPAEPPGFGVRTENFVSRGYGMRTLDSDGKREVEWSIRRARGLQALYYQAVVFREPRSALQDKTPSFPPVPTLEEPYATALQDIVTDLRAQSADVATFAAQALRRLANRAPDANISLFLDSAHGSMARVTLAKTLLAGARIPTRIANGIHLRDDSRSAVVEPWLAVHDGQRWLYFDPRSGDQFLPEDFLVWWYGEDPLVDVRGGRGAEVQIAVQKNLIDSMEVADRRAETMRSRAIDFSVLGLPVRTQSVYAVLLLVPLGAFAIVLLRNFVGLPTFGTFTPVLIALAFRETQLLNGIILFSLVVALGLTVRFYLERLRLLLVPRLAAVLTIVVLLLLAISVLSDRLGLETGLSVALFPFVILVMVIERMSVTWEERGAKSAMNEALGTLVAAIAAYLVMSVDRAAHLVFVFPELLLILLACSLLVGQYGGYRVSELIRFRHLGSS